MPIYPFIYTEPVITDILKYRTDSVQQASIVIY